jgi:hypothetical protein
VVQSAEGGDALCWALIGNDGKHLAEEYSAGVRYKLLELEWAHHTPAPGAEDAEYLAAKHAELNALRAAGFGVILSFGLHNPPRWIHDHYANSYYVNQYGDRYVAGGDGGDVNFVFNPELRTLAESYIRRVFDEFGTDFSAVRLGGGRFGELTYPPDTYNGKANCYWSFDDLALAGSPTPNWHPGLAARRGEARPFLQWYLNQLVDFQNWQITATRAAGYEGPVMMLYPSWGIRPGDLERAVRGELLGLTSAEQNGEIQRGYDFSSQVAAIRDPGVIVTTTWLDADASGDGQFNSRRWSPVKYLASLAAAHPLHLYVYGENTGEGTPAAMEL